ncbi:MAG TPA: hypothetical protein VGJ93_06110 [Desulfuromonadaceae bacterium]|jgi:hypothetical protein
MDDSKTPDETFGPALSLIRRRRRYFFATILLYMPAILTVQKISPKYRSIGIAIGIWIVILFVTALRSAVTKCPRCGNYFHMHGMTLLYLRKCLHCQLHINADRKIGSIE